MVGSVYTRVLISVVPVAWDWSHYLTFTDLCKFTDQEPLHYCKSHRYTGARFYDVPEQDLIICLYV